MPRDDATLLDIAKAAQLARSFVAGLDKDGFLKDAKTQAAVIHEILILGEATKRLSEDVTNAHPSIPWRRMAGMRDKLIHEYDRVDLNLVWEVVTSELPRLVERLRPLLPAEPR